MIARGIHDLTISVFTAAGPADRPVGYTHRMRVRRRLALEKLAHAIEYLADEFVYQKTQPARFDGQLEAIKLLMALNRSVYFEYPEASSLRQRCWTLLRRCLQ